jgi:hypothetical protein
MEEEEIVMVDDIDANQWIPPTWCLVARLVRDRPFNAQAFTYEHNQECMCGARPGEAYQLEKNLFIKPSLQPKHTLLKLPHAKK